MGGLNSLGGLNRVAWTSGPRSRQLTAKKEEADMDDGIENFIGDATGW